VSLPPFDSQIELFGLQVRRDAIFEADDRYRIFAEKVYPVLVGARERLASLYCADNGRPAIEPVVVLGVSLLQFMERLPDRQALEHLKYHVGWKYALGQELGESTFDATVLVRFRQRLVKEGLERVLFEEVVEALEEAGLVAKQKSVQRLDSTHVLGLVSRMSHLDRMREAMRLMLESMVEEKWPRPLFWGIYWERYVESKIDYGAPSEALKAKLVQVGEDIRRLLKWLSKAKRRKDGGKGDGRWQLLKKMFEENFEIDAKHGHVGFREPMSESRIENPHDPEATYRRKQDKKWVGYAVQVAETVPKGNEGTGFITSMATQTARASDEAGLEQTLEEQASMGFDRPRELIADGAYLSAEKLARAQAEHWRLTGPVMPPHAAKGCYGVDRFRVNIAKRQARCPAGRVSTQCSRIEDRYNRMVEYRFEWSWKCQGCALRQACIGSTQTHRTIRVRDNFMYLQARRAEMKTERFKDRMRLRAGIEGTISELVRAYGLRRARYRGLDKMRLQNYFTAAACNVARWIRRIHCCFDDIAVGIFNASNPVTVLVGA